MISLNNQLEIRHLHYFLVLAETLHYGQAAERLLISQSALSQQIQRLEVIVKQQLFNRSNRSVELSAAGKLFKKEAEIIIGQLSSSMERWNVALEGHSGMLKIGFVGSAMQEYLPKKIKELSERHPKIKFVLQEGSNQTQLEQLEKNQLDIGFMRSNEVPETMDFKSVAVENLCVVLPKEHPITSVNFESMEQFSQESFILFPNLQSQLYYQQIISLCASHGFMPKISHQSIHGPTIFKLVESGLGISVVPKSLTLATKYKVRFIELEDEPFKTELFAVWKKKTNNEALNDFLKIISD
ncbi:LysR substrate-binding domain-containing protein [Flagellimonas pacifica]|uniref:Transcriptional regulator, LysR family n=1 Tax=Flagellimonas pacifica TaxID=1247520 RepID=A0A285MW80_9FLAO|nr:LysR substrate-binding domain-containing protein [Allomuricauda parva]SNZ00066.1 transcriptional regulator, LysR family [Allomuricauda parva]